ncbi:MAG: hypothetical protein Q9207_007307, partial [Kuettlingeria erythrocarpa]
TRRQAAHKATAPSRLRRSARLNPQRSENLKQQFPNGAPCKEASSTASPSKKRKRSSEGKDPLHEAPALPLQKRLRVSCASSTMETPSEAPIDPIDYWRRTYKWPKAYFKPEPMSYLLARKKSEPSLSRKRSRSGSLAASSTTPSDQKPREEKSAPYRDPRYKTLLETLGTFMRTYVSTDEVGISADSERVCKTLLETEQRVPKDTLFDDDIFWKSCDRLDSRNEAKVIQNIGRLLVPSVEALAMRGPKLECLIESVNEGWNNSVPLTKTRPQPDYSVGFRREAFSDDQLDKLSPFIGDFITGDQSFLMATYYMYFPFLTSEVKCGEAALNVADRQNAQSMTLAVRAIVELFRLVKREKELHREILAFSISHDNRSVRIYGHYPIIQGNKTTFYRHTIRVLDLQALEGKEKWTTNIFTQNVYNLWMPKHLDRIRSIVDEIPSSPDFTVPPLPQTSGLSQGLESHCLTESLPEPESLSEDCGSQPSNVDAGDITSDTSLVEPEGKRSHESARKSKQHD